MSHSASLRRYSVVRSRDHDAVALITRLQAGDAGAFDELYALYLAPLYGYMAVALRDHHEAEDATQEVFVKALVALPSWEMRDVPFRVWLFRVARNHLLDRLPRLSRMEAGDPDAIGRIVDSQAMLEQGADVPGQLDDDTFLRLVKSLPRSQRQVLVLRYVFDMSFAEIAQALETTSGAARNLQQRAFAALRPRFVALGHPERERLPA